MSIRETNFPHASHTLVVSQALTLSGCPAAIQSIEEVDRSPKGHLAHVPSSTQEKSLTISEFHLNLNSQKSLISKEVCQLVLSPKVLLLSSLETKGNWSVYFSQ